MLFVLLIGFISHEYNVTNYWYFEHAFAMAVFLLAGHDFKRINNKKLWMIIGSVTYVSLHVLYKYLGVYSPALNAGFKVSTVDIPMYLVFSISGSLLILFVACLINKSFWLEWLGKNSLLIYLLHITVYYKSISFIKKIMSKVIQINANDTLICIIEHFLIFSFTLFAIICGIVIFDNLKKYIYNTIINRCV